MHYGGSRLHNVGDSLSGALIWALFEEWQGASREPTSLLDACVARGLRPPDELPAFKVFPLLLLKGMKNLFSLFFSPSVHPFGGKYRAVRVREALLCTARTSEAQPVTPFQTKTLCKKKKKKKITSANGTCKDVATAN